MPFLAKITNLSVVDYVEQLFGEGGMRLFIFLSVVFLAGCQTVPVVNSPISMDANVPIVSNSSGHMDDGIIPIKGIANISFHPDRKLRMDSDCTKILRLNYASNINYSEAVIGLKNRALLIGGNAVSIVGWAENSQASGLTGNIYMCEGEKPYHIHPHP